MESGGKIPYKVKTGWLGRGMKVANLKQEGLALALPMPLLLRGVPQNNNYHFYACDCFIDCGSGWSFGK